MEAGIRQQLQAASIEQIVVLPDNDEPGQKHAEDVARSCHAAGLAVKVVTLPGLALKGDISDWLDLGHTKDELITLLKATALYSPTVATAEPSTTTNGRVVTLTPASDITPRPVQWGWQDRLALGTFNLMGGREGIGKSIVECTLTADLTRGRLPGVYFGTPKAVIIVATEDARNYTIVPRLMAAGADLSKVFFVDVQAPNGVETTLSLPCDLLALEQRIVDHDLAAVWFDPILSRLDAELDSHKDGEVRQALEPLSAMAERTNCLFVGLIHVNKSASNDPLTTLMASRAFAAVPRAVLFVMVDPQDEQTRLLGLPKNNLGRSDLPTLAFQIRGAHVADTPEGAVWTGKLHWTGETERSIHDALQEAAETKGGNKTVVGEAADWLQDYLTDNGGSADSADVKRDGLKAGHGKDALQRARQKLSITTVSVGFPRRTHWALSASQSSHQSSQSSGETSTTTTTATTTANHVVQSSQSSQSSQSCETPRESATTGDGDRDADRL